MTRDVDALIVGGGVVGAVMASLLIERGLVEPRRVALIDERLAPPPGIEEDWDLRVVAVGRASQRLLEVIGVWPKLPRDRVCPYERMCVWDASGRAGDALGPGSRSRWGSGSGSGSRSGSRGRGSIRFDAADLGEPNLGSIVESRALQRTCLEAAMGAGVLMMEARVTRLEMPPSPGSAEGSSALGNAGGGSRVRVRLHDGRELDTGLLLAADGVDSRTRDLLRIETATHAYHQDALVAHVRTERPHQDTAWQRFLPTGPLAFLPLSDGRCSIVWSLVRHEAERLRVLDAAAFGAALTEASDGVLGAVEVTTPIVSFPLRLQHAERYVTARAVLLGDAAHAVHPLAGQGLNLGLLDCAVLAEILSEARSGGGRAGLADAASLRRYERRRRSENLLAAAALDGLERLFSNTHPLAARLRAFGLEAVGHAAPLRNHLARRALGLAGDVPAFLRTDPASSPKADPAWRRR
ncbi:MAG TPA: FAD-dependent monooxygenase [Steroidobacteraceae bacterium]|nr:FAD-dependent monooxygenase [Steroidobacteraceae bacterium]